ncbi:MAG TPA: hypothetical protein PLP29_06385 [Candidatus Ozemobacteraceae bacterium]|nr:hypothetical protein [Candidatus Ozemobacteraceae bacterium]
MRGFLAFLETRLPAASGPWLLGCVTEEGAGGVASAAAAPELAGRFIWEGVSRPGAAGAVPTHAAGRVLLDVLNPSSALLFQVDTSLGPVNMTRLACLDRFTVRVVCSDVRGGIVFLDEIPWSDQLEWDLLLPAHCLVGGAWIRRVARRVTPMSMRREWMVALFPANREELNAAPPDVEFIYLPAPAPPRPAAPAY